MFELSKLLFERKKWIQKVTPVEEGATDEELRGLFCGLAGPSGTERAARSDGPAVHRPAGDAVWGDKLLGYGAVCADEGLSAGTDPDAEVRTSQSRHFQPGVPDARPAGLRAVVPAVHEGVCQGRQDQAGKRGGGARRQGAAAQLRARQ